MPRNVFTVTLPEGQGIAKRTSQSRAYTWAVVKATQADSLARSARQYAADCHGRARRWDDLAETGIFKAEVGCRWQDGTAWHTYHLDGVWVTSGKEDLDEVTVRQVARQRAQEYRASRDHYLTRSYTYDEGPEVIYSVVRWSSSWANADKASRSKELGYGQPGVTLYVTPVDAKVRN